MDEKESTAEAADSPRRRRVPPPTIDLEATETPQSPSGNMDASSEAAKTTADAPPAGAGDAAPRRTSAWALIGAGTLGAVIAIGAAAGAWMWLGIDFGGDRDRGGEANTRLTRIEAQLDTLARRPSAPAAPAVTISPTDPKALAELTERLARIEAKLTEQASAIEGQIKDQIKPLADKLADLGQRNDQAVAAVQIARDRADTAAKSLADVAQQLTQLNAERARAPQVARADLDALATRLAGVESAVKTMGEQVSHAANGGGGDTREAVVALALKSAVERGAPYASELDAVRPFADAATLAALDPFAKSGVPSTAALAHEASVLVPELVRAADTAQPPGALARLWVNAKRMIRLRPVGDVRGAGAEAVIARLELKAGQNDLDGVVAEAGNLPPDARATIAPWIKRVQARGAALAAADRVATATLQHLGRDASRNSGQNQGAPQR
jgi:hypothetical protein